MIIRNQVLSNPSSQENRLSSAPEFPEAWIVGKGQAFCAHVFKAAVLPHPVCVQCVISYAESHLYSKIYQNDKVP